ncbi:MULTISPECIES: MaoC/PaaZ C-terminal domain-containing protein [Streptomyces]|uniref:MaoC/PaaZ C-terminal domain-containing protein n=1 Tax=Streptomyces TaxID=1883 RepID=UPI000241B0E7|nr:MULTISPECIES: MaoC/PaaZ C-terminal domain-containing protein [Streptomyces]EHM23913.1 putative dehydratase [Streptomyces sp. W007]MCX4485364.1 MaoC/PaaZ C-terminal domain-containing protein [Streptomyces anulatus]WSI82628.1 MaoC/PaaZ C-terminal domain-containing protein [Streptomyces anulatus]WSU78662.1 MaoC/PaaZ C-terminal domain-containing protein [Streptomyces anulatus]WTD30421.1 MaoC/PaaZ C-terminal domain-containing protein [Streptomyces anulatus]
MTSLTASLARGALTSPFKRAGRPDATLPPDRPTRPAAPVAPGPLAAYGRVCGFPESGPLPLTYPHVLAFPLTMRLMTGHAFPLPVLGLVHTWIEITPHRAVAPAEPLELTVYAQQLTAHRRGTEVTMATEARVSGELVWESRSGYLSRHRQAAQAAGPVTAVPPAAGSLPARAEWRLPGDLGRRYGSVSGDRNPIHLHPLTARLFGFPRAIAHGMWTVARCLAEAGDPSSIRSVRAGFRAPVLLPATVTYAADATGNAFELRGPDGRVHLVGTVTRQAGGSPAR